MSPRSPDALLRHQQGAKPRINLDDRRLLRHPAAKWTVAAHGGHSLTIIAFVASASCSRAAWTGSVLGRPAVAAAPISIRLPAKRRTASAKSAGVAGANWTI